MWDVIFWVLIWVRLLKFESGNKDCGCFIINLSFLKFVFNLIGIIMILILLEYNNLEDEIRLLVFFLFFLFENCFLVVIIMMSWYWFWFVVFIVVRLLVVFFSVKFIFLYLFWNSVLVFSLLSLVENDLLLFELNGIIVWELFLYMMRVVLEYFEFKF